MSAFVRVVSAALLGGFLVSPASACNVGDRADAVMTKIPGKTSADYKAAASIKSRHARVHGVDAAGERALSDELRVIEAKY